MKLTRAVSGNSLDAIGDTAGGLTHALHWDAFVVSVSTAAPPKLFAGRIGRAGWHEDLPGAVAVRAWPEALIGADRTHVYALRAACHASQASLVDWYT